MKRAVRLQKCAAGKARATTGTGDGKLERDEQV